MACYDSEILLRYLDNEEIDEKVRREMDLHVSECGRCSRDLESLRLTLKLLKESSVIKKSQLEADSEGDINLEEIEGILSQPKENFPELSKSWSKNLISLAERIQPQPSKDKGFSIVDKVKEKLSELAIGLSQSLSILQFELVPAAPTRSPRFRGGIEGLTLFIYDGGDTVLEFSGMKPAEIKDSTVIILDENQKEKLRKSIGLTGKVLIGEDELEKGKYYLCVEGHIVEKKH